MSNEQLLASIEEMLDRKLDERFKPLEQRMDRIEQRMDSLEQRMDTVEATQKSILEGQERMYISISETMETMIEKSEARMKRYIGEVKHELTVRMDKIESITADTRDRVSNVEAYVVSIDKRVKKLEHNSRYTGGFVSDNITDFGSEDEKETNYE